jgi:hypothetical protein
MAMHERRHSYQASILPARRRLTAALCLALLSATGTAHAQDGPPPSYQDPLEMYARIERDRAAEVWARQQQQLMVSPYPGIVWPPQSVMLPYWMPYQPVHPLPPWGPWCGPSCWPYPVSPVLEPPGHAR